MLLLIATMLLGRAPAKPPTFFVSPTGSDSAVGSRTRPFKTLEHCRDAVRIYRRAHSNLTVPIRVVLERGVYQLAQPFQLTPLDSGTAKSPTIFSGEQATISGGEIIHGFKRGPNGWWTVNLPEVREGKWRFAQLFVNGDRRYRPRWPKAGYSNITAEVPPSDAAKGHGFDRFGFKAGDIVDTWHNLSDVELLCFHTWDMSRMRIGSVDNTNHVVTTTGPTGYDAGWANFPKGNRFIAENVWEAFGMPGEWYLDNASGDLTYAPLPGESMDSAIVVAPRIDRLVDIHGDVQAHQFVDYLTFENINFEFTNWNLPAKGRFFPQAEIDLGAAVHAEGWRHGVITGCDVSHVGEYAIEFNGGCSDVVVRRSRLFDLGAGGVKIGEPQMYADEGDTAQNIQVTDNIIAHGGRLHPAAIGVWIGQSSHNWIRNNDIYDLYYTGISDGWTWGYGKSQTHDNEIAYNDIYLIGQGVLSDMGGIYTLGVQPGTVIAGNRIHDVDSFSYGGWGIYPDEGSSHEMIEDNLVYCTKSGGFHQHYGEGNVVQNNIFAFAREAEIIRTRAEDHISFTFDHNIVYWKDAPLLGSNWTGNNYKFDNNLYWRTDGKPVDFAGMTLEQWRAKGQDVHGRVADPGFVDPNKGDFRLKPSSPAAVIGFTQKAVQSFGPRAPKLKPIPPAPPAFQIIVSKSLHQL